MDVEFDPAKDATNRDKHGVSLAFGARIWSDPAMVVVSSIRPVDGEMRWKAIGRADGRLWTVVHVVREARTRFISVRRSNDPESRTYHRHSGGP